MISDDVAAYLIVQGVGTSANVFAGQMPEGRERERYRPCPRHLRVPGDAARQDCAAGVPQLQVTVR